MGFIYILQSEKNFRYYIGSTNNLERRLKEHNSGKGYTKLTRPFKLAYFKEYETLKEAREIERKLKKLKSRRIIERIIMERRIRVGPT